MTSLTAVEIAADDRVVDVLAARQHEHRIRHRHVDPADARAAARTLVESLLPTSRVLSLRRGDAEAGLLWLGPDADTTPVYDVVLDGAGARDDGSVDAVRALATGLAGAPLSTSVFPGEPVRTAFVADGTFEPMATTMRLDLAGPAAGAGLLGRLDVAPMTEDEVSAYLDGAVEHYAAERAGAGESEATARAVAEATFEEMFPGGRPAEGHTLLTGRADGAEVGILWVCHRWPAQGWVYDVEVVEERRGQGLGASLMSHAERWARGARLRALGLNVFGPNARARSLYEGLGYLVEEEHLRRAP